MTASEDVRAELERRVKASTSAHRDRFRAQIILLRLAGLKIEDAAGRMNTSMPTVSMWSNRFERFGLDGLKDKTGRGRKASIPAAKIERVITEATRPPEGRNHWSVRSMGRHAGMSHSDLVLGFQHESDAHRFLDAMRTRFEEFALSLHPDKTRLIEFGRHAAVRRARSGLGKPDTFNFLGFTFFCGCSRRGSFQLKRKSRRDRVRAKLREIKEELAASFTASHRKNAPTTSKTLAMLLTKMIPL